MAAARIWLDVPYAEKDEAKAAGARWDPAARRWFAPRPDMASLQRWAARPDLPDLLPGEDRSFGDGLFVDLIPSSCWFTNVRSCVAAADWERLRRMITNRAGQRCEACQRPADREQKRWLEAHERWEYLEAERIQRLKRLVCLCTDCHQTTHYGLAGLKGREQAAFTHLMTVTGFSRQQARRHVDDAFAVWQQRSAWTWELDLSMLTKAGVTLAPPPGAKDRVAIAEQRVLDDPLHPAERRRAAATARMEAVADEATDAPPPVQTPPQPSGGRRPWWAFWR